eukprot:TRINITY_DN3588_c0_g1_i1.p1 TRINITY_DN3588_c0_g1~~TRINITY_DN3588_c0_g1_i1.p1  ORF type:complete len:320 (-),score=54.28 TRINITY_DN3588_c0_g1_i1:82-1041(-)
MWHDGYQWSPYDSSTAALLEQNFATQSQMNVTIGSTVYTIDFQRMTQTNTSSRYVRKILREAAQTSSQGNTYVPPLIESDAGQMISKTFSLNLQNPNESERDKKKRLCKDITCWEVVTHPKEPSKDECSICLDVMFEPGVEVVKLSACNGHHFHSSCIVECFQLTSLSIKCPLCSHIYGIQTGNQPDGQMKVCKLPVGSLPLEGYENVGTIQISYEFPDGLQTNQHPFPGKSFKGTKRVAYLPDNTEGQEVLSLLEVAWKRKLLFTVGTSVTTGQTDVVIWNGIHHKTKPSGGSANHGYPDPTYISRIKQELKLKGVCA